MTPGFEKCILNKQGNLVICLNIYGFQKTAYGIPVISYDRIRNIPNSNATAITQFKQQHKLFYGSKDVTHWLMQDSNIDYCMILQSIKYSSTYLYCYWV